jgi:preprotein translocase subunit SecD
MLNFSKSKTIAIIATCLVTLLFGMPNFFSKETVEKWPSWLPHQQLALGLDLRGGAHLLLSMDMDALRRDWLTSLRKDVRKRLSEAGIATSSIGLTGNAVVVRVADPEQSENALKALRRMIEQVGSAIMGSSGPNLDIQRTETGVITIRPTPLGESVRSQGALAAAVETVRSRIDKLGTAEPVIVQQGSDRILVQVPGYDDTTMLRKLIGETAKLSFHEVYSMVPNNQLANTRIPPDFKAFEPSSQRQGGGERENVTYILREEPIVQGEDLVDASPAFDEAGRSVIHFRFNQRGARAFGDFTRNHIKEPFAIVLDGTVLSAPTIQSAILGGSGQIFGNFDPESAKVFAVQLRSGALPAKLTVVEERTVGASLGQDSIDAGWRAGIVGSILVAGFMIFAYGLLGIFAVIGAAIHVLMVIAMMTAVGSTITLPGIAGIVLTIGMAVDANVLINERIREELRGGRSPLSAIEAGFSRAYATIVDSQLTTFIAGLVMFWLGSGPIRGFAVTLTLGIITTVFTAFTIARLLVVWWIRFHKGRKLPPPLHYKMSVK